MRVLYGRETSERMLLDELEVVRERISFCMFSLFWQQQRMDGDEMGTK